jgi:DNA modification methylase
MTLLLGDSLERLKELPADSVDACVCDPPYGLSFMNKHWDYDVPSVELWREVLRVLKPGAHLLSFGGTRTYHRMVVAIEDAGFEIRDQIMWIYGSGFPKSMNIGKAIDKQNGIALEVVGKGRSGSSSRAYQSEEKTTAGHYEQTQSTNEWSGWGTALKPANEPIVLARKPLEAKLTVAANVLKHGTGAINMDASRIGVSSSEPNLRTTPTVNSGATSMFKLGNGPDGKGPEPRGRWPANLILDECAAKLLDEQSGILKTNSTGKGNPTGKASSKINVGGGRTPAGIPTSVGGASRFFYVAKASKRERNAGLEGMPERECGQYQSSLDGGQMLTGSGNVRSNAKQNHHPTVKPIKLMEYLVRMITPPGGTVLDPFLGSGSTLVAAARLGFKGIGCEMSPEYLEIARRRIEHAQKEITQSELPLEGA